MEIAYVVADLFLTLLAQKNVLHYVLVAHKGRSLKLLQVLPMKKRMLQVPGQVW